MGNDTIKTASIYLFLSVMGAILPYIFFAQFFAQDGMNLSEFIRQLFATSPAAGFTADLLVSSTTFWIWSFHESRKNAIRHWWVFVALNIVIGLSFAFPLFLYFLSRAAEPETGAIAAS